VVFPGAAVRRGAHVVDSVLMNGVIVGAGATVQRAIALPVVRTEAPPRGAVRAAATIGDRCAIGSRLSAAVNADFPDRIRDGITVIGMGVELPPGLRVEAGCLVGPGATTADLRRLKALRRGQTVPGAAA
jgi:NDP-sugar pyrophosphorylase family protein